MLAISLPLRAQGGLEYVLQSIENNNLDLQSAGHSVTAMSMEARMGNTLEPLSVSYSHLWGSPEAAGKSGELEISQEFDFPSLYAARKQLAGNLAAQYENGFSMIRQQVLLEAKELYLEQCALTEIESVSKSRLQSNEHLAALYASKLESGDATLVDKNRTEFEYLLLKDEITAISLRIVEIRQRLQVLNGGIPLEYEVSEILPELIPQFEKVLADYEECAPELLAAKLEEEGAGYDLRVSRRQSLPKFEVGYKYEFATGERFNGVTAGLSIPIFSNRYNVKRAKAVEDMARTQMQAAIVGNRNNLQELYTKAEVLGELAGRYDMLFDTIDYPDMLARILNGGEMNIVDYYSELNTYFATYEAWLRVRLEYSLIASRINMIYL